jgi:hypothetical protein
MMNSLMMLVDVAENFPCVVPGLAPMTLGLETQARGRRFPKTPGSM